MPQPLPFTLVEKHGQPGLRCDTCGMTSFHPTDVRMRYCANCDRMLLTGLRRTRADVERSRQEAGE